MKRMMILSAAVVVLLLTAVVVVVVQAKVRVEHAWCSHRWHRPGPASYLDHELNLSDAQRAQIHALWQAERPALAAHIRDFLSENKDMNAIAASGKPDPGEVQKVADREANTIAALLVEKADLQSKFYSTLRPEQRAKADELQKKWESRLNRLADRLETQSTEK
jgi:Spy/CpxP family protein refolding chaperone